MAIDPARASMAFGDDLVFALEKRRRLFERPLVQQLAAQVLVALGQIPVLGKLLGEGKAFLLGAGAAVASGEIGGALS